MDSDELQDQWSSGLCIALFLRNYTCTWKSTAQIESWPNSYASLTAVFFFFFFFFCSGFSLLQFLCPRHEVGRGIWFCPCPYVRLSICLSHFVVLFLSPQLLLQYLTQGIETCNIAQTCIEHVHKGNRTLI